jgi:tRNA A-37 threonylcarbamoyl transferase component Bud32
MIEMKAAIGLGSKDIQDMEEIIGRGRTAELMAWGEGKVLKLYFDFMPVEPVDYEFNCTRIAYEAGLPVPVPYERVTIDGRHGIVSERIYGKTMMGEFQSKPWKLAALFRKMAEVQVACQNTKAVGIGRLKDHLEYQIRRAGKFGLTPEQSERVLAHLKTLPDADGLCHMDFHPENILVTQKGYFIIDWMNTAMGHPLGDTARSWMMISRKDMPGAPKDRAWIQFARNIASAAYRKRYQELRPFTQAELDAWMLPVAAARLVENIPGENAMLLRKVERLLENFKG